MSIEAFDATLWALDQGAIVLPKEGLILIDGAVPHALLRSIPQERIRVRQDWQPTASQLHLSAWLNEPLAAALVFPAKQRDRALGDLATAAEAVVPGGLVLLAAPNTAGAGRFARDLTDLLGNSESVSKHKARVAWGRRTDDFDMALAKTWEQAAAPAPILDGSVTSQPGLFAWDRVDPGSALLAECLPEKISGRVADIGCGWGFLAREVIRKTNDLAVLDLYDADARAVALAGHNVGRPARVLWRDVMGGLDGTYDLIFSNPPFHEGQARRVDLGQGFIRTAAGALAPGGRLMLVANRSLPYERIMGEYLKDVAMLADAGGYKVLTGVKA
ncbi:class I SAM-dependent methyltransferase [Lacibacterium aquatile]|uniref:Class I SAM-dependent methyltransferase n=1 Tax=Lacibacterium aquatile TaxID=1168082 RepID=A0ABW5DV16_9PROT